MNNLIQNTLPKDWKLVELKDVLDIQNGYAFNSKAFNFEGKGKPLIRIRNLKHSNITTYYNGNYDEKFIVKSGDYLIGMDGEFRCYEWKNEDALLKDILYR